MKQLDLFGETPVVHAPAQPAEAPRRSPKWRATLRELDRDELREWVLSDVVLDNERDRSLERFEYRWVDSARRFLGIRGDEGCPEHEVDAPQFGPLPPRRVANKPFSEMTDAEMLEHTAACRKILLDLAPGQGFSFMPDACEGRPVERKVKRLPCAGRWFEVTISITVWHPSFRIDMAIDNKQMLRLSEALHVVRSNHVPVCLAPRAPKYPECPECGKPSPRSFLDWCQTCAMEMCMTCANECGERHDSDPAYRRPLKPQRAADEQEEMRLVSGYVNDCFRGYVRLMAQSPEEQ